MINMDGYIKLNIDGYGHTQQLNIKLTIEDMKLLSKINNDYFDNEITNSTLGRILIRKGIKYYEENM